jgi:predicted permease
VVVSPGYFETMGIPLVHGRDFTAADRPDGAQVMVLGAETARRIFGDSRAALGRRVRSWRDENVYREVVGVVGDVRIDGADDDPRPVVYVPHAQSAWRSMIVAIRTEGDPLAILPAARASIGALDPRLALGAVTTMDDVFAKSVAPRRFAAFLLSAFALLALLLAAVGIYGVLSYAVAQRTREIGVRIALGAERGRVLAMVMREAGVVVLVGSALGVSGALLLAHVMSSLLYDVAGSDPFTRLTATGVLAAVARGASLSPARRATRIAPRSAMRAD